ncbi:MAG: universal stress protein [Reichenbachiella sp.]
MKNILVPFDFSGYAEAALDFALELNQVTKGSVTLLNVIEYPLGTTFNVTGEIGQLNADDEIYTLEQIKKTKSRLKEFTESPKYKEANIDTRVMMGNPYEGIINLVNDHNTDVIIMGTKGATGLKEMFIGSNAEKVVRNAKCPVISIHKEQKFTSIKKVVYATSLDTTHGKALETFKVFQELLNAELHLVWVHTPHELINEEMAREKLEELAKKHNLKNYETHVTKGFYPEEGILMYAWNIDAQMIALPTHSYKGLAHMFLGSIAEDIVNHATIPVWTMSLKNTRK